MIHDIIYIYKYIIQPKTPEAYCNAIYKHHTLFICTAQVI